MASNAEPYEEEETMKQRKKVLRDWQCQECGRRMTLKAAEKAAWRDGCVKCGGSDVDIYEPSDQDRFAVELRS